MTGTARSMAVWLAVAAVGVGGWLWLSSCGGGGGGGSDTGPSSGPVGKVTVSGQVTGSGGIEGVTVSAGGVSDQTDTNGVYSLADVPVPSSGRLVLTFEKDGYATYQRSLPVVAGETYAATAKLLVYDVNETVDASVEQNLEGKESDGTTRVKLNLPEGSIGTTGNVTVRMALGDPTSDEGQAAFPGDYMAAEAADGEPDTPLESVAFAEITLEDSGGNEISELAAPAELKVRLPDEFQAGGAKAGTYTPGSTIEWWSYDEERGVWVREDADPDTSEVDDAVVVDDGGVLFAQGRVTHFTWWNADRPVTQHACLCVRVLDDADAPVRGAELVAQGVSYNGTSYPVLTGEDGTGCVNVKRTTDEENPEQVELYARAGNLRFGYDVTDASEGDVETDVLITPMTQGSTRDNSGTCVDLMNPIQIAFDGRIQGTVTYEDSTQPVPGFTLYTDFGPTTTTNQEGQFEIAVPLDVEVLVFAPGLASQSATVTDAGTPAVLDFEIPNRAPEITEVIRTPSTSPLPTGTAVTFTATASDPDGDVITYGWTADAGSPASGSGRTFSWTAPDAATTAHIQLTVTDAKGATATTTRNVVVGGTTGGTSLRFLVRDDPATNQPVEGVYVILHGADGRSVERTIQTGSDGIAEFGDVGRSRVTVTVAWETQSEESTDRQIDTFVQVLAGEVIYYTDGGDEDPFCATPDATVTVSATGIPAGAGWGTLVPFGRSSPVTLGAVTFPNVPVCPGNRHTDGTFSPLVLAREEAFTGGPVKYGFLADQTVTDGATYDIVVDRDPLTVTWSTQPETGIETLGVAAQRKGVSYALATMFSDAAPAFGTIAVPNEFPADSFTFTAGVSSDATDTYRMTLKRYDTVAQTVTIPVADWSIDSASADEATETFTWSVSGDDEQDAIELEGDFFDEGPSGYSQTSWSVILAPGTTSWTVVTLPAPVSTWADASVAGFAASVGVIGVDFASGFDDLWSQFIQGLADVEETAGEVLYASRPFSVVPAARVAARAAAEPATKDDTPAERPAPLRGFQRIVRR